MSELLRMVFRNYFLHKLDHVRDVDLAGKVFQAGNHKLGVLVVVLPDLCNADAVVERRKGVLIVGKNLFVEFFSRTEA